MSKVKVSQSVSELVTRSPIELLWTANNWEKAVRLTALGGRGVTPELHTSERTIVPRTVIFYFYFVYFAHLILKCLTSQRGSAVFVDFFVSRVLLDFCIFSLFILRI